MAFDIRQFRTQLAYGGARPTLFEIILQGLPSGVTPSNTSKISYMAKATKIPESTIGIVEVPYFGRTIRVAGNRKFGLWPTVIINDEDFTVRAMLEDWHHKINDRQTNQRSLESSAPAVYQRTAQVRQFSQTGQPIRVYNMINAWPAEVRDIDLDWGDVNRIEEFTVVWAFDYWELGNATVPGASAITIPSPT